MKRLSISILTIFIFCLPACDNKNIEEDFPADPCDPPTTVSFAADVVPILRDNCYRCHDVTTVFGSVLLEGYSNAQGYALNGELVGTMRGIGDLSMMPPDQSGLLECDIKLIEQWIAEGAQNN